MENFTRNFKPFYVNQYLKNMLKPYPMLSEMLFTTNIQQGEYSLVQRLAYMYHNSIALSQLHVFCVRLNERSLFLSDKYFLNFILENTTDFDDCSSEEIEI